MEKEELIKQLERYENVIDYDFWMMTAIKESVIELTDEDFWQKVMLKVSSKYLSKNNT